jgi:hypothetical protein
MPRWFTSRLFKAFLIWLCLTCAIDYLVSRYGLMREVIIALATIPILAITVLYFPKRRSF